MSKIFVDTSFIISLFKKNDSNHELTKKYSYLIDKNECYISNTILIEETIMHLKDKQTIVIVTHNLQQAERISDSIVFMYEGKIIEQGTTEQIFNHPRCSLTQDYLEGKME